jgi:hypothetical protein
VTDQPVFEAQYVEQRSRLTTFFRLLLAIPHLIVAAVWGFVAALTIIVGWFVLVFTGRWPAGLYDFVVGFQRYVTAVYGYAFLLTDEYPPFSPDTDAYPVHLRIPPAKAEYSRLKVLFRLILGIPVYIIMYAMQIVFQLGALIAWFAIVILGRQPKGLQDMIVLGLSYQQRAYCYLFLLTEDWPPFIDQQGGSLAAGPDGWLPPAPVTYAPPAAPEAPAGAAAEPPSVAPPSSPPPPPPSAPPAPEAPDAPPPPSDEPPSSAP